MLFLDQAGAGVPLSRRGETPPPLRPWVERAWIQRGRDPRRDRGWRIVPDPSPHIIVSASTSGAVRASLVGARSRAADARGARRLTVGIRFRPGTIPALAGVEAREVTDRSVALADVLPDRAAVGRVTDAAAAGDGDEALDALWTLLRRRLDGADPVDWRVRALDADPRVGPGEVGARTGISGRGLRAVAAAEIGLSPRTHLRVRRLQLALTARLSGAEGSWASASRAAGFHDPSHLVRCCRKLLGETPEAFRSRARSRRPCRSVQRGTGPLRLSSDDAHD